MPSLTTASKDYSPTSGRKARERMQELSIRFVRECIQFEPLDTYSDADLVRAFSEWASESGLTSGEATVESDEPPEES